MRNLVSKIVKPLLIPALALSLSTGIKAQNENEENTNKTRFNLSLTFGGELGGSYSNQKLISQNPFLYSGDDLKMRYLLPQADLFWVFEPLIKRGNLEWGFPVYYGISNFKGLGIRTEESYDKSTEKVIEQIVMPKKTPSFGISTRIKRENKEARLWLELLTYKYSLLEKDGWGQRATVGWFYDTRKDPDPLKYLYLGFYLERAHKFIETGFTIRASMVGPPCTRPLHDCY